MKKIKNTYPYITSFPLYVALFTICSLNEELIDWLCIQYINICGYFINNKKDNLWIDLYSKISDGMNKPVFARCPYITYNKIYRAYFSKKEDFVKFIEKSINDGKYIYLHINPNNISIYNVEDRTLNIHECLISGYDNIKKEFLCSDFFNSPIYKFEKITYDELFQGFMSLKYQDDEHIVDSIYTIKMLNKEIEFDYYSYYIMFCEYIGKRDCSLCVPMGLHVYDLLIEYINECSKNEKILDYRIFSLLSDHKKIIIRAIKNIFSYLNEGIVETDYHSELIDLAKILNRLIFKYKLKNEFDYEKLIKILKKMRILEYEIIQEIIINYEIKYDIEPYGIDWK